MDVGTDCCQASSPVPCVQVLMFVLLLSLAILLESIVRHKLKHWRHKRASAQEKTHWGKVRSSVRKDSEILFWGISRKEWRSLGTAIFALKDRLRLQYTRLVRRNSGVMPCPVRLIR